VESGEIDRIVLLSFFGRLITFVFEGATIVLFMSLTWFASLGIQAITGDVRSYPPASDGATGVRLVKWKKNYIQVLGLVEDIEGCFGPILVAFMTKMHIQIVTFTFNIVNSIFMQEDSEFDNYSLPVVKNLLLMMSIIAGVRQMKKRVKAINENNI